MNHICPTCYQMLPPGMDGLSVSLDENCIIWKRVVCQLTRTEAEVASLLADADQGKWVMTDHLIARLYGAGEIPMFADKALRVHIAHIRRKLKDAGIPVTVENSHYRKAGGHSWRFKYGYD